MTILHNSLRLGALALFAFVSNTVAADFPQRIAAAALAQKTALAGASVPLLRRAPGFGRDVVADIVLKRFSNPLDSVQMTGVPVIERRKDRTDYIGKGWSLRIDQDGTSVRYRHYGYLDNPLNSAPLPVAQRMSQDVLQKYGLDFIKSRLGDLIPLAANEQLVPFFSEFQISGDGSTSPGVKPDAEEVIANTVVFSRVVNGIAVLGAGSKIAVIFANTGKPVGFDFDWARYEATGEKQATLNITDVNARMAKLTPVDLKSTQTKLARFECGYFDFGVRRRDPLAPVQTACAVHVNNKQIVDKATFAKDPNSGHALAAFMQAIPLGAKPALDNKWPEVRILLGMSANPTATPPIEVHK